MLLLILWRLVTACSILLGLYMLYFGAVALFGFKKRRAVPRTAPKTKFACVVAARDEEAVIADLVHSLRRQNYPPELFDIIVAPNNCDGRYRRRRAGRRGNTVCPQAQTARAMCCAKWWTMWCWPGAMTPCACLTQTTLCTRIFWPA